MTRPERTVGKAGTRVLVVEDDAAARTGLTELRRAWEYETTAAVDGEDALAKVKTDRSRAISLRRSSASKRVLASGMRSA
jgi:CheY-like chemotaxis protein